MYDLTEGLGMKCMACHCHVQSVVGALSFSLSKIRSLCGVDMHAVKKTADRTIRNCEGPTKTNPEQHLFPKSGQLIRPSVLRCTSLKEVKLCPAFLKLSRVLQAQRQHISASIQKMNCDVKSCYRTCSRLWEFACVNVALPSTESWCYLA